MQRIGVLNHHFEPTYTSKKDSLSVVDNRTGTIYQLHPLTNLLYSLKIGKTYELPIKDGAINATDLSKIKDEHGEVTRSFDPAYMNTVNCVRRILKSLIVFAQISRISYIDGDKGILEYRGYPIEQLAEKSSFLEVSFLLVFGELPNAKQLSTFSRKYVFC